LLVLVVGGRKCSYESGTGTSCSCKLFFAATVISDVFTEQINDDDDEQQLLLLYAHGLLSVLLIG